MNKCFIDLMYEFTEALRQLDNAPRLVASLLEREKTENLFFEVLGAFASMGIAEEDLNLLTRPAEMCFGRSHTRTRIDGRSVPYLEGSRRERFMALLNRSV